MGRSYSRGVQDTACRSSSKTQFKLRRPVTSERQSKHWPHGQGRNGQRIGPRVSTGRRAGPLTVLIDLLTTLCASHGDVSLCPHESHVHEDTKHEREHLLLLLLLLLPLPRPIVSPASSFANVLSVSAVLSAVPLRPMSIPGDCARNRIVNPPVLRFRLVHHHVMSE